jgi:hypothetical protein
LFWIRGVWDTHAYTVGLHKWSWRPYGEPEVNGVMEFIFEELGMASRFLVGEAENTIRQR